MLLPPSEWPLKTSAQYILAYVHSPPVQMSQKISGLTGPKFTIFLSDVEESSSMLTRCDIPIRCWMSARRMKTGVSISANTRHKSLPRQRTLSEPLQSESSIMKPTYTLHFLKVWRRSIQAVWWKHRERAYFGLACTHPPMQMSHEISGVMTQVKAHLLQTHAAAKLCEFISLCVTAQTLIIANVVPILTQIWSDEFIFLHAVLVL